MLVKEIAAVMQEFTQVDLSFFRGFVKINNSWVDE